MSEKSVAIRGLASVVIVAAPLANLALASGALSALMIYLDMDPELIGCVVFGFYSFGLASVYVAMRPALELAGLSRPFKLALAVFLVVFTVFLVARVT